MKPLCEVVVTNVLPAVRAIIAKHLKDKYNMKGKEIADRLYITPAAVTQYLKKARGAQTRIFLKNKTVKEAIISLADSIAEGKLNEKEEVLAFCDICKLIRREKVICELHAKTPIVSCDICSS
ncbi:MAG: hypothetical protein J7K68_02315 [Candidatus Diapherotrites archaeon]|nr:hypothetical protein [Candidatus Diapherotrites archaeon]